MLNVYKLNIFNTAVFMHKIQGKSTLNIFLPKFRKFSFVSNPSLTFKLWKTCF